ncbi:unnamed protein product [Bursaphelenchus okinawaensis]|uniref:Uncharacterized protein n=1 Tax=Bursaphelenchus okinawaensis TaxID=465554 RepID=A0A811JRV2_9BILA|nr:unnamed protein product [Bursaphelenchus okinawaensis]CAG9079722.1 unnamed protein product [Bursaphelenchus okinawaensis]
MVVITTLCCLFISVTSNWLLIQCFKQKSVRKLKYVEIPGFQKTETDLVAFKQKLKTKKVENVRYYFEKFPTYKYREFDVNLLEPPIHPKTFCLRPPKAQANTPHSKSKDTDKEGNDLLNEMWKAFSNVESSNEVLDALQTFHLSFDGTVVAVDDDDATVEDTKRLEWGDKLKIDIAKQEEPPVKKESFVVDNGYLVMDKGRHKIENG